MSKPILVIALLVALGLLLAAGCAITDYPVITDTRGDFTGVIRTGHKAYIIPTNTVAWVLPDGSDELFTVVNQNQYGDQMLSTYDNYDPTASVFFLDQTYCDWRYDGCVAVRAWNPANPGLDDVFDYEGFRDCPGFSFVEILAAYDENSRMGECGDGLMRPDSQHFAAEFANLLRTAWRGEPAYTVPVDASTMNVTFRAADGTDVSMPIYGHFNLVLDDQLRFVVPMTPNARHELRWMIDYAAEHGRRTTATIQYGSFSTSLAMSLRPEGLQATMDRF